MTKTYTFTARDGQYPERTLTLTLFPEFVRVNLTGLWDQLGSIASAEDKPEETKTQIMSQAEPVTLKVLEAISGPIHIRDFNAALDGSQFKIQAWQRLGQLRLAPVSLTIDRIDNPDGAEAFISELESRQQRATRAARFPGILDYWITWMGMLIGFIALILWPQKQQPSQG